MGVGVGNGLSRRTIVGTRVGRAGACVSKFQRVLYHGGPGGRGRRCRIATQFNFPSLWLPEAFLRALTGTGRQTKRAWAGPLPSCSFCFPHTGLWLGPCPGPGRAAAGEGAAAGGPGGLLRGVRGVPAAPEGGQAGQDAVGVRRPPERPGRAPGGAQRIGDPDEGGLCPDPGVAQPSE